MNQEILLEVRDLAVRAGERVLLQPVSFTLRRGEALVLLGESGAGKSLLAQAVMGNLPPSLRASGEIVLQGQVSAAADAGARRPFWGRGIGLLPQEPGQALNPVRPVASQLAEVFRLVRGQPAPQASASAAAELSRTGLAGAGAQYVWQLSGGMAQRAMASMALAGGAPLLLADEPTKGLDAHWLQHTVRMLQTVQAEGGAVLVITHELAVARALGGRVMVLRNGELVEQGDTAQQLTHPQHEYTRALVAADPAGWPAASAAASVAENAGTPLLLARGLSKAYGPKRLFADLDLDLQAGERLVLQGPSGTGKSTLGNVLLGLVKMDAGSVQRAPGLAATAFQKLYQDPVASFAPRISLRQALQDVLKRHRQPWAALQQLLADLGVDESLLARRPGEVSGGELQRIALARILSVRPALLFADEPTSRLDPLTQQQALRLLDRVLQQTGAAMILVTHDEGIARAMAPRSIRFAEAA